VPVLVRERLLSGREIDDAETAMGESRMLVAVESGLVGAPVSDDIAHARRDSVSARLETVDRHESCNSTHMNQSEASWDSTARSGARRDSSWS